LCPYGHAPKGPPFFDPGYLFYNQDAISGTEPGRLLFRITAVLEVSAGVIPGKSLLLILKCVVALLAGTHFDHVFNVIDKYLAVTDIACIQSSFDRVYH